MSGGMTGGMTGGSIAVPKPGAKTLFRQIVGDRACGVTFQLLLLGFGGALVGLVLGGF
jgi:hypothetical protein